MNPMKTISKIANATRGSSTKYRKQPIIDLSDLETDNITEEIEKVLQECRTSVEEALPRERA